MSYTDMPKYVFLDIDGTLVDENGKINESTDIALLTAVKNGHRLFLATGRLLAIVPKIFLEEYGFAGVVSDSGANVICDGEQIFTKHFPEEDLETAVRLMRENDAPCLFCSQDDLFATKEDLDAIRTIYDYAGINSDEAEEFLGRVIIANPNDLSRIEKFIYLDSGLELDEVRALLGENFQVDGYSFGGSLPCSGEVTPAGVTKAAGIRRIEEAFGIPHEDTVAIGDGKNDIAMIAYAGIGVAMGNACKEVKACADFVTDPMDEDGLYGAFERLGLL